MKRLLFPLLCAAALGLTGCNLEGSMSSSTVKANLESKGYVCQVMSKTEAEARIKGINYVVNITDAAYANKGEGNIFLGFFCANIADAEKFVNENISVMVRFAEEYTKEPKAGFHNNMAYCGNYDAVAAAGVPVSQ